MTRINKSKLVRVFLRSLPYLAALAVGLVTFLMSNRIDSFYRDLCINISAAFLSIPLLYLFYELAKSLIHRKLNKEVFDYAKMQIDTEVLSILNQLQKIVIGIEQHDLSFSGITKFLALDVDNIRAIVSTSEYLGFVVLKHWSISERKFHKILSNPYILLKLGDDQIIAIVRMLKSLRSLELIQKDDHLYNKTDRTSSSYKVVCGSELNKDNQYLPDRHLLLRNLDNNRFVVADFGDIAKYNIEKCLDYYAVNTDRLEIYSSTIHSVLSEVNSWLDATDKEFLVDPKMFRIHKQG